jgi:hypothetical protein
VAAAGRSGEGRAGASCSCVLLPAACCIIKMLPICVLATTFADNAAVAAAFFIISGLISVSLIRAVDQALTFYRVQSLHHATKDSKTFVSVVPTFLPTSTQFPSMKPCTPELDVDK